MKLRTLSVFLLPAILSACAPTNMHSTATSGNDGNIILISEKEALLRALSKERQKIETLEKALLEEKTRADELDTKIKALQQIDSSIEERRHTPREAEE